MDRQELIAERIAAFDGDIRLLVRTFDGRQFAHSADTATDPMSVIKLAYLYEAYQQLDMTEMVTLGPEVTGRGTGILCRLNKPITMPVLDLVTLMVVLSDNIATDYVLSRLDRDLMEGRLKQLGLADTFASHPFGSSCAPPAPRSQNVSTPRDICTLLEHIRPHAEMMDILAKQLDRTIIHHFLPADVKPYTKSGQHAAYRHDAGILQWDGGGAYITLFGVRSYPATNPRELLEYDMQLAPIAEAAYLWARG